MLSDGGQDMDGQLVGVRIINGHEFHASVHQRGNECQISG
jgi:hypothetical protein